MQSFTEYFPRWASKNASRNSNFSKRQPFRAQPCPSEGACLLPEATWEGEQIGNRNKESGWSQYNGLRKTHAKPWPCGRKMFLRLLTSTLRTYT